jgi:hypothetical protein
VRGSDADINGNDGKQVLIEIDVQEQVVALD